MRTYQATAHVSTLCQTFPQELGSRGVSDISRCCWSFSLYSRVLTLAPVSTFWEVGLYKPLWVLWIQVKQMQIPRQASVSVNSTHAICINKNPGSVQFASRTTCRLNLSLTCSRWDTLFLGWLRALMILHGFYLHRWMYSHMCHPLMPAWISSLQF